VNSIICQVDVEDKRFVWKCVPKRTNLKWRFAYSDAMSWNLPFRLLLVTLLFLGGLSAQSAPDVTQRFPALERPHPEWGDPFPAYRVIGNVYYVGTRGIAAFLVTTPQGYILINSGLESSVPLIRESVEKLGFRFSEIKILLISHAHWDHCAGSARVKELTGAKYMVMDADVADIEAGGKGNFHYGKIPETFYTPVKVDRILHDSDEVKLGGVTLVAHLTPGHTKGCTTWTMQTLEGGKTYNIVIVGGPRLTAGYKLVDNALYPRIAEDHERMFRVLKSLPCDVFLGAHGNYYDMESKFARMRETGPNPFIDPAGYKSHVAEWEQAFRVELKRQQNEEQSRSGQ
jgi:metallo-beta-lactamase class B